MIVSDMLFTAYNNLPQDLRIKRNESELSIEFWDLKHEGKARISIKGADNPDSLRGVKLAGCVIDEYADIKKDVLDKIIRPALVDYNGWAIITGTPKGFNHFYDLFNFANKPENSNDWVTFHFTTYDNPYIDKKEIELAKKELNEDYFSQEFLGEFKKFTGLVYKDFDRKLHVIEPFDISNFSLYRSIDFGTINPFACVWIAVDGDDNWYIYDEHYQSEKMLEYHANIINSKSVGKDFICNYRDPSATQLELEFAKYGIYLTPAINVVNDANQGVGISKIQQHLKISPFSLKPKLFVFNTCVNTIIEFEKYHWEEQQDDANFKNIPHKSNDHALDAIRYFANSYIASTHKSNFDKYLENIQENNNSYTGY